MSSKISNKNIDELLFKVAKEYKRICKRHAEPIFMTIVGGGAILLKHSFRSSSTDIDSYILGNSLFYEAIKNVAEKNDLPSDWINSDFERTSSFSGMLSKVAKPYKKYCNILIVDVVDNEYLIAMKLASFRPYKHDYSDIVGILKDMYNNCESLNIERFENAYFTLYNERIPKEPHFFLSSQLKENRFIKSYDSISKNEENIGQYIKSNNKNIHNSMDLQKTVNEIKVKLLNERIIDEIGDYGCIDNNIAKYNDFLRNEYETSNNHLSYEDYLKEKLEDNYDLFFRMNKSNNEK